MATFRESSGPESSRMASKSAQLFHRRRLTPVPDHELELPYLDSPVRVFKRPLLDSFLMEVAKQCELVVFSSGSDGYVRELAQLLDTDGTLFEGRVLSRTHCTVMDVAYVKDLQRLGRPLERVVLVDDNLASCIMQPDNAVPLTPFLGDPEDRALSDLLPLVRLLIDKPDVRAHLSQTYSLRDKLLNGLRDMRTAASKL